MPAGSLAPVARTVTFVPGLVMAAAGGAYLGQPLAVPGPHEQLFRLAGLGVFLLAGLVIWPALVLSALLLGPAALAGLVVPRGIRGRYRRHLIESGTPRDRQRSSYISKRLRRVVSAADRHRCVACKTRRGVMHVDHCRPWIAGGRTVLTNLFLLCERHNLVKSNYNKDRDGYEHYHGDRANIAEARWILRRERIHRWNPFRWVRAAWALAR